MKLKKMSDNDKTTNEWKDLKTCGKVRYIIKNITIEPVIALYIIPNALESITTSNLKLEKACLVNLNYPKNVCEKLMARNDIANLTAEDDKILEIVTAMNSWVTVLHSLLPLMLLFFIGSWSDRNRRRKPCLLMPLIGEFISILGLILCTYCMWWPMEVNGLIEGVFPSLTGGWMVLTVAIYSYIADITTEDQRTIRLGVVNMFVSLGLPFGTFFSGFLYQTTGYYGVFSTVMVLYLGGILYGAFIIKESQTPKPLPENFLVDFFDFTHVPDTFKVALKKRQGNTRLKIFLVVALSVMITGPIMGEGAVGYYFTRKQLQWNEVDYALYSTYLSILSLFGTMIVLGLFTSVLHLDDAVIGMIACSLKVISNLIFTFSKDTLTFYLVALIEMISGTSMIAMRSILTKLVPSEDLGKMNSVFGIIAALVQLTFPAMYNMLYSFTVRWLPGAFFILGAELYALAAFIFLYIYLLKRKEDKEIKRKNSEDASKRSEFRELISEDSFTGVSRGTDAEGSSKALRLDEVEDVYEDIKMIDE